MKRTTPWVCLVAILLIAGCGGDDAKKAPDLGYLEPFDYVPPRVRAARPESIGTDPESGLYVVRGEVLVALDAGRTVEQLKSELSAAGIEAAVVGEIENFGVVQIEVPEGETTKALAAVEKLPSVRASMANGVQWPTREFDDPLLTDADAENDWGLQAVGAQKAWDRTLGEGIKVAVIDSGCDPNHPDLKDRYGGMYSFSTRRDGQDLAFDGAADHGTHVAGTVAATAGNGEGTAGVAPSAEIIALQAIYKQRLRDGSEDLVVTSADLIAAINMAVGLGAHVVNMSLGPTFPPAVQQALDDPARRADTLQRILAARDAELALVEPVLEQAAKRGVVVVVAAGNNGRPASWCPLPSSRWTISVGAVDSRGQSAEFWGPYGTNFREGAEDGAVDLCAPGKAIWSCKIGGGYKPEMGTSMAAPHVAGAAALLRALDPSAPFETIRDVLVETATRLNTRRDIGGRLDVAAAVEAMAKRVDQDEPPPKTEPTPPPKGPVLPPEVKTWTPQPRSIGIVIRIGWRPQCWLCQLVRFLIDRFLRLAIPVGGGRYDAWGRVQQYPRRVAMGPPPNRSGRDRFTYVWDRSAELTSSNMGALATYVVNETDAAIRKAGPRSPPPDDEPREGASTGDHPEPTGYVKEVLAVLGDDPGKVDRQALLAVVRKDSDCVPGGVFLLGVDDQPEAQRVEEKHLAPVRALLAHEKKGLDALYEGIPRGAIPGPYPMGLLPWVRLATVAHAYLQHAVDGHGKAYELKGRVLLERLWQEPRAALLVKRAWPVAVPSAEAAAREAEMGFDWSSVR